MKKRFSLRSLSCLLALSLLSLLSLPAAAAGADGPTLSVGGDTACAVGERVSVTVDLADNGGFGSIQFDLTYDAQVLELTGYTFGPLVEGGMNLVNDETAGQVRVGCVSATDWTGGGTVITLDFLAQEEGVSPLTLGGTILMVNSENQRYDVALVQGSLTVGDAGEPEPSPEPSPEPDPSPAPSEEPDEPSQGGSDDDGGDSTGGRPSTDLPDPDVPEADLPETNVSFTDVPAGTWYTEAVQWAVENGITAGTSATTFSPDLACSRAQMVTFLWRTQGSPAPASAESPFTDVPVGAWYADAVQWAVENGVTAGTSAATFSPDMTCTRAQMVSFLWRLEGSPAPASAESPFTDVPAGAWYADAVQWAVENGVTAGTSSAAFSPDMVCTRAQMVTVLYRCFAQ